MATTRGGATNRRNKTLSTIFATAASYASAYEALTSSSYSSWEAKPDNFQCGGSITGPGTIRSPNSANNFYYDQVDCFWNIALDPSVTQFTIVAKSFSVEECAGCGCDWLEIIDRSYQGKAYCGLVDPNTLRRRRSAEKKSGGDLEGRQTSWQPTDQTGLKTHTVNGNMGTIRFYSDDSVSYRGFELCISIDGDDSCPLPDGGSAGSAGGNGTTTDAPATPAEAWDAIAVAAADVAVEVDDFYAALPGLGKNSVLASKKVDRYNAFFNKMLFLQNKASADPCDYPAGSNDPATFVAPVDSDDACEKLQGVFASLMSFVDSYVCMNDADESPLRLTRLIQRQRMQIVTRKLKQMKCGN
ncbi:Oidioi.mRNA.OKI2018_I69.chr2.g5545.t1.cds [Oikopleura dioica]|uniref:Oidioi.mRNA.OKI2018_I69.chr2.g5545.t1.cds n=1 Tax=Oikopleura dioica TaxID=34765 RepID=A0ABN7T9T4_OIKDI|nr:Oidioi.mRNA.OKI2018_I69.chr2.g5545.t1.cds [Oikopleura dioica]